MIKGFINEKVAEIKSQVSETVRRLEVRSAQQLVEQTKQDYGHFQHSILARIPLVGPQLHAGHERRLQISLNYLDKVKTRQSDTPDNT